jgi:DNA-binding HxlR family transcriptional regulator
MTDGSYNQFCPVAMAAEVLCSRWTFIVLRELVVGSTRFNEIRRGVPRMSPALLSKRLKELEAAGIVTRRKVANEPGAFEYRLTEAGKDLKPIIEAVGVWGHKWVTTAATLKNLDPDLLMWDIRRNINAEPLPPRRSTIQFIFKDRPKAERNYWLIIEPGKPVDLCTVDPGFDVDLYLSTDLPTMTEIWMGYTTVARARDDGRLTLTGDRQIEAGLNAWLKLSSFAKIEKLVA